MFRKTPLLITVFLCAGTFTVLFSLDLFRAGSGKLYNMPEGVKEKVSEALGLNEAATNVLPAATNAAAETAATLTYTLTYNGNGNTGGSVPVDANSYTNGQIVPVPGNTGSLAKTGYGFGGWTNNAGTVLLPLTTFAMPAANTTLYAKWLTNFYNPDPGMPSNEFVLAPAGTFVQSNTTGTPRAFTHTLSAFYIGKYEVTYELWYTVRTNATNNGYSFANNGREGQDGTSGEAPTADKYEPVTYVNWRDCMVWCNAYSEKTGLTPCYTNGSGQTITNATDGNGTECDNAGVRWNANGFRLPTEGEWQYAASYQNGTSWTPYSWASGATADYNNAAACQAVAWYLANAGSVTHAVGLKTANQLIIYDMSGNVSEWCGDWDANWPGSSQTDYKGPGSGTLRVYRGGRFYNPANNLQVGNRYNYGPGSENYDLGFRLTRR